MTCKTTHHACDCQIQRMEDLEKENKRYRKALELYAFADATTVYAYIDGEDRLLDRGDIAREALKQAK